jgi:hypothetical protein
MNGLAPLNTARFRNLLAAVAALVVALLLTAEPGLGQSGSVAMNPSHPERYVVRKGDTLWDISGLFLRDPWYWPEIWQVNPQIDNPHLIYPGDILTLVYIDGRPTLRLERGADRLSPRVREEALDAAIPTIPYEDIAAFLASGQILQKDELESLPYIAAMFEGQLMAAAGDNVYVRGDGLSDGSAFNVVNVGDQLVDPDDGSVVGYHALYVAAGEIRRTGDPATMFLTSSRREALRGDRLVTRDIEVPVNFEPRMPTANIDGRIIAVLEGLSLIGQYQVVVLNRGDAHGLEPGHVLGVWQAGEIVTDRHASGLTAEKIQLPEERAGTAMVFHTYDRISYALVMEATSEMRVLDVVRSPG